jgi:hypothetical protein
LRVRDARRGVWVVINDDFPRADLRGERGQVLSVDGRIVRIRLDNDNRLEVAAPFLRKLDATSLPESPANPELEAFKRRVAEVAREAGREHDLCEELDGYLKRLGIEPLPQQVVRVVLEIPEDEFHGERDQDETIEDHYADQLDDVVGNAPAYRRVEWVKKVEFIDVEPES